MGQPNRHQAKNLKMKALSALVFSACVMPTMALDLGRLQILSSIGEPLRAEVDIAQASPDELRTLRAQLASPGVFNQAGMEFNAALNGVTAVVETRSNGAAFIALMGRAPVQENFLDLILETQSSSGRLVKNYALLLNSVSDRPSPARTPATTAMPTPSGASNQTALATPQYIQTLPALQSTPAPPTATTSNELNATSVELNAQRVPVYRFAPVDNTPSATASAVPSTNPSNFRAPAVQATPRNNSESRIQGDNTLTVKPGDTASRLALRFLGADVSLDQMLLAMLKANPDAFIQGNVNLVKAGAVLRMPKAEEAAQTSRAEARQTVIAQTRDFAEYARKLAQSPLLVDAKNSRAMSGKVTAEAAKTEAELLKQDKLTLSKPSISADASEAKLASERESQDAAQQLAALNKNLKDLEALNQNASAVTNTPRPVSEPTAAPSASPSLATTTPLPSSTQRTTDSSFGLKNLVEDKQIWTWAGALLALILLVTFWARKKSHEPESVYAPSYDDIPSDDREPAIAPSTGQAGIPAQMSSIDLNLQAQPLNTHSGAPQFAVQSTPGHTAPTPPANSEDTEQSKLNLAAQLLTKGDKDLARALILSVVSSSQGDLKARAVQLLGQIR